MSLSCDLNRKITKYFFALLLRKTYASAISGVTPITIRQSSPGGPPKRKTTQQEKDGPFGPPNFSLDPSL